MPVILHHWHYRPAATPSDGLPFGVRSIGHYKVVPPYSGDNKKIDFLQFFWCARGAGIVEFEDHQRTLQKNQIALYYPGMHHYWHADREAWELFFFTLDGPSAASLPASFGLQADIYNAGPAPAELFRTLLRTVYRPTKQAELKACSIAFEILTRAANAHMDQTDELVDNAVKRMHKQYASPELNIKTLSASIGVRRALLSVRFHAALGMTPSAYLERLRLQSALSLLTRSHWPVAAVAYKCGYADARYFARVIRRVTGGSPLEFREKHRSPRGK